MPRARNIWEVLVLRASWNSRVFWPWSIRTTLETILTLQSVSTILMFWETTLKKKCSWWLFVTHLTSVFLKPFNGYLLVYNFPNQITFIVSNRFFRVLENRINNKTILRLKIADINLHVCLLCKVPKSFLFLSFSSGKPPER